MARKRKKKSTQKRRPAKHRIPFWKKSAWRIVGAMWLIFFAVFLFCYESVSIECDRLTDSGECRITNWDVFHFARSRIFSVDTIIRMERRTGSKELNPGSNDVKKAYTSWDNYHIILQRGNAVPVKLRWESTLMSDQMVTDFNEFIQEKTNTFTFQARYVGLAGGIIIGFLGFLAFMFTLRNIFDGTEWAA
jgi:hypothetical protein